jgi:putative polyhydroxyalkanoate system protein
MSSIHIEIPHTHSPVEVQRRVSVFSDTLAKYGARLVWKGSRAEIQGIGVSGEVNNDPGRLKVSLKLGLVARVAGVDPVRLEGSIRKKLAEALG